MQKEVALAHIETMLEWAQTWEHEAVTESREAAAEVAFLLRRAAQKIGSIHGTDISFGPVIPETTAVEDQGPLPDLTAGRGVKDELAEG